VLGGPQLRLSRLDNGIIMYGGLSPYCVRDWRRWRWRRRGCGWRVVDGIADLPVGGIFPIPHFSADGLTLALCLGGHCWCKQDDCCRKAQREGSDTVLHYLHRYTHKSNLNNSIKSLNMS
jgi:hypothetical protein